MSICANVLVSGIYMLRYLEILKQPVGNLPSNGLGKTKFFYHTCFFFVSLRMFQNRNYYKNVQKQKGLHYLSVLKTQCKISNPVSSSGLLVVPASRGKGFQQGVGKEYQKAVLTHTQQGKVFGGRVVSPRAGEAGVRAPPRRGVQQSSMDFKENRHRCKKEAQLAQRDRECGAR